MYNFNALFSRTKYIPRWSLMRQSRPEYVAEHTAEVMQLAHTLAEIANAKFNKNVDVQKIVMSALYHDISEILTGDMPTPVKYNDDILKNAYKDMEKKALSRLCDTLDPDIRQNISQFINTDQLSDSEKAILKAADKISALIKCIEEKRSGNSEFLMAQQSIYEHLLAMNLQEVNYFIHNMLPAYELCLDELAKI